jgi:hypothetical protein
VEGLWAAATGDKFCIEKSSSPHQQKTFRRSTRQKLCRGNARVDKERHKFDVFAESFPWSVQQSSEQQKFFPLENDVIFNVCSTFIFYPGKILKGSCSSAAGGEFCKWIRITQYVWRT